MWLLTSTIRCGRHRPWSAPWWGKPHPCRPCSSSPHTSCYTYQEVSGFSSTSSPGSPLTAYQVFEPLQALPSPLVLLGCQIWEAAHSWTGLPWWAAIPATTFAIRTLLLPATMKAKSASEAFPLYQQAISSSGDVLRAINPEGDRATLMERVKVTQWYYQHLLKERGASGLRWYVGNSVIQGATLLTLTASITHMSHSLWPGLTTEGFFIFSDLTLPAVNVTTYATAYGVAGLFLPLTLLGVYLSNLDYAAASRSLALRSALEVGALPIFLAALAVPHATVWYWLAHISFTHICQLALSGSSQGRGQTVSPAGQDSGGSLSSSTPLGPRALLALAEHYDVPMKKKDRSQQCVTLALKDPSLDQGLRWRAAEQYMRLGCWPEAASTWQEWVTREEEPGRSNDNSSRQSQDQVQDLEPPGSLSVGYHQAAECLLRGMGIPTCDGVLTQEQQVATQRAISWLKQSLSLTPHNPKALLTLAVAQVAVKRDQEALETLRRLASPVSGNAPDPSVGEAVLAMLTTILGRSSLALLDGRTLVLEGLCEVCRWKAVGGQEEAVKQLDLVVKNIASKAEETQDDVLKEACRQVLAD